VADYFRYKYHRRPNVDLKHPDVKIHVHIQKEMCTVSLDSSGDSLHKRGYRTSTNIAPINEVLAAGLIELSNWDKKLPFVDGMCGSGTIVIEALMKATNTAPSIERKNYAFMFHPDYDSKMWYKLLDEAKEIRKKDYPNIKGIDIDGKIVNEAKDNFVRAGFKPIFHLEHGNLFKYIPREKEGVIIMNPPYDVRLKSADINKLYKEMGDHLKKNFKGWTAYILSGNVEARKKIGLKPSAKIKLFNGKIECRLLKFEMF